MKTLHYTSAISLAFAFAFITYFFYLLFTPADYWVFYEKIIPAETQINVGDSALFISYSSYRTSGPVEWTDILRCDFNDGRGSVFYSSYVSNAVVMERSYISSRPTPWEYQAFLPQAPADCYLDSATVFELPFGITKVFRIKSEPFKIL